MTDSPKKSKSLQESLDDGNDDGQSTHDESPTSPQEEIISSFEKRDDVTYSKISLIYETHYNWLESHRHRVYAISERADATLLILTGWIATLDKTTIEPFRLHLTGTIIIVMMYAVTSIIVYSYKYHLKSIKLNDLFNDLVGDSLYKPNQKPLLTHPSFNLRGTVVRASGHSGTVILLAIVSIAAVWSR